MKWSMMKFADRFTCYYFLVEGVQMKMSQKAAKTTQATIRY